MLKDLLDVRLENFANPIGRLFSTTDGAAVFHYDPEYLESEDAMPISISLPLREQPFSDQDTRAFFNNLLQENDQLQQVMERESLARDDVVGLLKHLGADCPGALSCIPFGEDAGKVPGDLATDYDELSPAGLAEIVRRLADREPMPDDVRDPSPIAGVQRKLALAQLAQGRFGLPKRHLRVPTTHILKVPRRHNGREARLEAAAAQIAAASTALNVTQPDPMDFDGIPALIIRRYDRTTSDSGLVTRIHQEDFAQALGLPASMKYERYGTEGRRFCAESVAQLLDHTAVPAAEKSSFVVATFFNLAIGNTDNHAKNHALIYDQGAVPRLAPLYDLVPTKLDPAITHELAFKIGGSSHSENIAEADLHHFLSLFGIRSRTAIRRYLGGTIAPLLAEIDRFSEELTRQGLKDFDDLIGREMSHVIEALGLDVPIRARDLYAHRAGGWNTMS